MLKVAKRVPDSGAKPLRIEVGNAVGEVGTVEYAEDVPDALRAVADEMDNAAVREWAAANGYEVSPRGRIPKRVVDAYRAERGER